MNVIMRKHNGTWDVAAQDVSDDELLRALEQWRLRGYHVTSFKDAS